MTKLQINMVDWFGNQTRKIVELNAADVAAAVIGGENVMGLLAPLTNAQILGGTITVSVNPPFLNNPVSPYNSNASERASLNVHTSPSKTVVHQIPAPVQSLFVPNSPVVDIANADLQAYIAWMAANATVSDGEVIDAGSGTGGIANGAWASVSRRKSS